MQAFEFVEQWIVTPAWLHTGPPRDFIIDSSAGWTVITPATAEALGLPLADHDPTLSPLMARPPDAAESERPAVRFARLPLLRVAGLTVRDQPVLVMDLPGLETACAAAGRTLAGVLGYNILRSTRLIVDFPRRIVRLEQDS